MTWKEADAIRLAYQRCAWALEDLKRDGLAWEIEDLQRAADAWKATAELLWKEAK